MAKNKVSHETSEKFEQAIEKDGNVIIVINPDHLKPQAEPTGPPPRPKVVDPKHLKPQE